MKRFVSLLLSLSLVLSVSFISAQAVFESPSLNIPDTMTGKLIDDEGNVTLVIGYRKILSCQ